MKLTTTISYNTTNRLISLLCNSLGVCQWVARVSFIHIRLNTAHRVLLFAWMWESDRERGRARITVKNLLLFNYNIHFNVDHRRIWFHCVSKIICSLFIFHIFILSPTLHILYMNMNFLVFNLFNQKNCVFVIVQIAFYTCPNG